MDKYSQFNWIILIGLALLALWALLFGKKYTKKSLADFYGITKPTLAKWIQHFQSSITAEEWTKKRHLSSLEYSKLKQDFGTERDFVLSTALIADRSASTYKVVAKEVKNNLDKIGLSSEAWKYCSTFPPNISKAILSHLS